MTDNDVGLETFVTELDTPDRSLAVVNRSQPEPIQRMLNRLFADQPVPVEELDVESDEKDLVLLVEDGEVVASSSLDRLMQTILLVNSDMYITGSRQLDEVELPEVLAQLDETRFRLRGYPASNSEKLLLIAVSRVIERRAYETGVGTLRSSFQHLGRIRDERGTQEVYARLAETDVDVHVYGMAGTAPDFEFDVTVHTGEGGEYRHSWFVVFTPPEGTSGGAALVAIEDEPNVWDGFWTYRPELVRQIEAYIAEEL